MLIVKTGFSQQQRAAVWYFGNEAGIDFSTGSPKPLSDGNMLAETGCAVISNSQGELQFYTNGMEIWNRNHQIMANGDSLYGSQYLNQNSIVVPKPLSADSLYYLFTINNKDSIVRFTYSVVNMNKQNGNGEVVLLNKVLAKELLEKIAAVQHCNGRDYWILTHDYNTTFQSMLLTNDSITSIVKSNVGTPVKADIGYLRISPAGDKVVLPINKEEVLAQLFDFDNKTGVVSNPVTIYRKANDTYSFGFEFSPDDNLLYMTTGGKKFELWQFNLRIKDEAGFNGKAIRIAGGNNFAMQLAPDNKIYIARENSRYLNVINEPDKIGRECNYQTKALKLSHGNCYKGLPNFVQSWFYRPSFDVANACFGDTTTFVFNQTRNIDVITWNFDPGEGNPVVGGNKFIVSRLFKDSIAYHVSMLAYHCEIAEKVTKTVEVVPYPRSVLMNDTILFPDRTIVLDPGEADSYLWNTGSTSRILQVEEPGLYKVMMKNNACAVTDSVMVLGYSEEVSLPNAFTPNNDGLNDHFKVVTTQPLFNFDLQIYDRNGMLVYKSGDPSQGWDGRYKGAPCPIATYVWYLNYDAYRRNGALEHHYKHGFVTIVK